MLYFLANHNFFHRYTLSEKYNVKFLAIIGLHGQPVKVNLGAPGALHIRVSIRR